MKTKTASPGIDQLENFLKKKKLKKASTAVLCAPTSINSKLQHLSETLDKHTRLKALFGPQHGIFGETQDNMIEWQDSRDEEGRPIYSLYGERRAPTEEQLKGIDLVFVDLFDIGSRYYTFIYSMSYMMKLCLELGKPIVICDRPNPLNGKYIEGPILDPEHKSFVGLHQIPVCHGMSMGELSYLFAKEYGLKNTSLIEVLKVKNWSRSHSFNQTGLLWTLPSPNMPNFEAARLFPGMCLFEATDLSEGRGTTRPFELIGAPFIRLVELKQEYQKQMKALGLEPVHFHRQGFIPTFHKHQGSLCQGAIQMAPPNFAPLRHGAVLLWTLRKLYGDQWKWKSPPYEYEYDKWPIDILAGGPELRETIDNQSSLKKLFQRWKEDEKRFRKMRKEFLIYRE